mgnify:CR=1 FL=1
MAIYKECVFSLVVEAERRLRNETNVVAVDLPTRDARTPPLLGVAVEQRGATERANERDQREPPSSSWWSFVALVETRRWP